MATPHQRTGVHEAIAARRVRALELRLSGRSYRAIAAELGCDLHSAHAAVKASLTALAKREAALTGELREMECQRLDALLDGGLWAKAVGGDLAAVDRVLKISQRRAALCGLDLPTQQIVTGPDGSTPVVLRLVEQPTTAPQATEPNGLPNVREEVCHAGSNGRH